MALRTPVPECAVAGHAADSAHPLSPNHAFLLDYAGRHFPHGAILDYGCGSGDVVVAGAARGLDLYGVEIFYGGSTSAVREAVLHSGLFNRRIFEIEENGRLPFPQDSFDLIFNDQVFEHVRDMRATLVQIARVLKPGGRLLSLFPSREVLREGHCGVPLAHRLSGHPTALCRYLLAMRSLGLGHHKPGKTRTAWARDFTHWLQEYCCYRTYEEIRQAFAAAGLSIRHLEMEYIAYRLPRSRIAPLAPLARLPLAGRMAPWLCRKLGGMVLESQKVLR